MKSTDLALPYTVKDVPFSARLFIRMLEKLSVGSLSFVDPAGRIASFGQMGAEPHATLRLNDWRACGLILRQGDIGFAEAYKQGWVDSNDLLALFTVALRNEAQIDEAINGRWWALIIKRLTHLLLRDNNRSGSRKNIHAHYDIGNDFYRLWLDPSMSYSAAIFDGDANRDLEAAQWAKYDRILDELNARPGQTVLEIGCGWGGFAERAARRGLQVFGVTLSTEQLAFAQERMRLEGLEERVTLSLTDYRDITGQFDHVVSIEMFEAVGERWWPTYFKKVAECLKPGGRAVIQSITIADHRFEQYSGATDFIQQYVFPGGMLPSPARFVQETAQTGLQLTSRKDFGIDYAITLKLWRDIFESRLDAVRACGLDEAFIRIWRMYYVYCEAGFRERRTDVSQFTLVHAA